MDWESTDKDLTTLSLALGALGAATLVLGKGLVGTGPSILVIHALVIALTTWLIRLERIRSYMRRFIVGLAIFMISSLGLYVAIVLDPASADLSLLGHAWRIGALLVIGAAVNLATARIAKAPHRTATA